MSQDDDDSRQYEATPERRAKFKKDGKFAKARDAGAVASISGALAAVALGHAAYVEAAREVFISTHGNLLAVTQGDFTPIAKITMRTAFVLIGPIALTAAIASLGAGFLQAGISLNTELLEFKPERLDPISRMKEIFSPKNAAKEVLLSVARVGIVGFACYRVLRDTLPALTRLSDMSLESSWTFGADVFARVTIHALFAMAAIASVDYGLSWFRTEKELKMTRKELTDETKASEGDQKLKHKMRAKARQRIRQRSISRVKEADVVLVNPTHVAVALRYSEKDGAPVVVAKGHDDVALAIRRLARKHGIPIVENRPLARALDAQVEVGRAIPVDHFLAVAKVLAFVYALKQKRP